ISTSCHPPQCRRSQTFTVPGSPFTRFSESPTAQIAGVDSYYLRTLGLSLVSCRDFLETDTETSLPVAVVNQEFVRRYFSNQDPVGRQIRPGPPPEVPAGPFADF